MTQEPIERNPFEYAGHWFWRDENAHPHGPYKSQLEALRGLMDHISPLWYTRWRRNLMTAWKDFLHDTRG